MADVFNGWKKALQNLGVTVAAYNTHDRLIFYSKALIDTEETDETGHPIVRQAMSQEQAILASVQGLTHALYTFWPDVVLCVSAFFMQAGILQLAHERHKLVLLHTESPYQDEEQLDRAQFAHLNLLNDPVNISRYDEMGIPALYMPHAFDPDVHYPRTGPRDPARASDFAFVGTAFRSRIEFFERMNFQGIDAVIGGSDWDKLDEDSPLRKLLGHDPEECVDNTEAAELYRHAKCGINVYRNETEEQHNGAGWAIGPREVEMAACELFYLRDPRGEGDGLFPMLPTFDGPEDAGKQLRWWLAHDRERENAAAAARKAIAGRTFDASARRLLALLGNL